ncbi:MAG: amidohydrolase [Bacteroidales bacterium]|nr:amidohydrolase [Bacteroidales bacterium]
MKKQSLEHLIKIRHELHRHPEISGEEKETAIRILSWLKPYKPDNIITGLGGYGLAAIYSSNIEGPVIMFRAELDALPLKEGNIFEYRSNESQVAHLCGHDGHMTFLLGLAEHLSVQRLKQGKIVLLFQPAEETGMGALKAINDPNFITLQPDFVFSIHNLPGLPMHQVITSDQRFAAASTGMILRLQGRTSHAAEPGKGRSPVQAVSKILDKLEALPGEMQNLKAFSLLTIIHTKIGDVAFGTTPGDAVVMATLRAYEDEDLKKLSVAAKEIIELIARSENLEFEITYTESFPATVNHPEAADLVKSAAKTSELDVHNLTEPFKWTEDFGHFTSKFKGALIGLGSGEDHPALHNSNYDFPDELIPTGVRLITEICRKAGVL